VFKYLLISIVIVPVLLGVKAANTRAGPRGLPMLVGGWMLYCAFWMAMLYFLRQRWLG